MLYMNANEGSQFWEIKVQKNPSIGQGTYLENVYLKIFSILVGNLENTETQKKKQNCCSRKGQREASGWLVTI